MADWTAIYRISDGALLGCGTVLPETLPVGSATRVYPTRPDQGARWDPDLRDFTPLPPPVVIDRLQDALGHPALAAVWPRLTVAQRTALRRWLVWLLGSRRYREPGEEVSLDPPTAWPTDPTQVTE